MSTLAATPPADKVSIELLESCSIDPADFNHTAHIYVGWCYLQQLDLIDAIDRFRNALKRLTIKLGVPGKYNETITWFFMLMIAERRHGRAANDWVYFRNTNSELLDSSSAILQRYYSQDRLTSPTARELFLLPDKTPQE
jgi:hypothetical protein